MKKVRVWKSFDGKYFDTKKECLQYETEHYIDNVIKTSEDCIRLCRMIKKHYSEVNER